MLLIGEYRCSIMQSMRPNSLSLHFSDEAPGLHLQHALFLSPFAPFYNQSPIFNIHIKVRAGPYTHCSLSSKYRPQSSTVRIFRRADRRRLTKNPSAYVNLHDLDLGHCRSMSEHISLNRGPRENSFESTCHCYRVTLLSFKARIRLKTPSDLLASS